MFRVPEELRVPECALEAIRRTGDADRAFVCRADENFGKLRVGLETKSPSVCIDEDGSSRTSWSEQTVSTLY
jgi:hypothetical protein